MESVTHLYTYPEAVDGEEGRRETELALQKLSTELELPHQLRLRGGHTGRVTVPDHTPEETWTALERAVSNWPQIFMPRPAG